MGNASLAFNRWGFEGRISFNYQGQYILAAGDTPALDNWLDNRLEVEFLRKPENHQACARVCRLINLGNQP